MSKTTKFSYLYNYYAIIFFLAQALFISILLQYLSMYKQLVPLSWLIMVNIMVVLNVAASFILLRRFILVEHQSKHYNDLLEQQGILIDQQKHHVRDMEEMVRITRSQRHDFINHLQTVYGLLQVGKSDNALEYITEVAREVRVSAQLFSLKRPEVSALLQTKLYQAHSQHVLFEIVTQTTLTGLPLSPSQINRVLGNLIDNAFEAVRGLPPDQKYVLLELTEEEENFTIVVLNQGELDPDIAGNLFEPGVSSKGENRGLGLSIAKEIIESSGGTVSVNSPPVTFTAIIPKQKEIYRDNAAPFGLKDSRDYCH